MEVNVVFRPYLFPLETGKNLHFLFYTKTELEPNLFLMDYVHNIYFTAYSWKKKLFLMNELLPFVTKKNIIQHIREK